MFRCYIFCSKLTKLKHFLWLNVAGDGGHWETIWAKEASAPNGRWIWGQTTAKSHCRNHLFFFPDSFISGTVVCCVALLSLSNNSITHAWNVTSCFPFPMLDSDQYLCNTMHHFVILVLQLIHVDFVYSRKLCQVTHACFEKTNKHFNLK